METHFKFQKSESSYLNLASDIQGTRGGGGGVGGAKCLDPPAQQSVRGKVVSQHLYQALMYIF